MKRGSEGVGVQEATSAGKPGKRRRAGSAAGASTARAPHTTKRLAGATARSFESDKSGLARRADFLVTTLGNGTTAHLLNVSQSQPSRWRRAQELPSPRIAPLVVDLDHVIGRLLLLWDSSVVVSWLEGANPHLTGARPIDVLRTRGSSEVVEAIDAEAEGAFA
jgi:hypothetical protein